MIDKYHHGDLRAAVLAAAAEVIARDGVDQLSLRSVAIELGVSHTAPRHHFGSREGVFTALACEGYELLADALEDASANGDFAAVGVAYVLFAVNHAGHFAVMHRPELVDGANADLQHAEMRAAAQLNAGARIHGGRSAEGIVEKRRRVLRLLQTREHQLRQLISPQREERVVRLGLPSLTPVIRHKFTCP